MSHGKNKLIEHVINNNVLLSIIIRADFKSDGIEFFTPDDLSQQLAYMNRKKGYVIPPHTHNVVSRDIKYTQEVLLIRGGKVRVDFYDNNQLYLQSSILYGKDVILLAYGGHGFVMLEDSEIIEVKQGPYVGERDKVRFEPISNDKVILK